MIGRGLNFPKAAATAAAAACMAAAPAVMALTAILLICPFTAQARTSPIDDSGTATYQPTVAMRWQEISPRNPKSRLMQGATRVRVRLNLSPWLGHAGRIYMVVPAQLPGQIEASWTTQGKLLPGRATSGSRALVYAGPITTSLLEDTLELSITVDGTQMRQAYNLSFRFEFDEV